MRVGFLVFGSGLCALVYQMVWTRELRLVFGSSTGASAAVLAIFMGGLGIGGLLLGRRAERSPRPLRLYAHLELAIALLAALTPFFVMGVREAYLSLGGSAALGPVMSTAVRLLLSVLMLGAPTFLMGGTLPALAKAVTDENDQARRLVGGLYAINTLGAVVGSFLSTFVAIELLGVRDTLWCAALLNVVIALLARWHSQVEREHVVPAAASEGDVAVGDSGSPHATFVMVAACGVGFSFFAMEMVWYRMLAPLLGGSSYSFGLILSVALLGVGLGGLLYGLGAQARRPRVGAFALTCALEALFLILPFAAGDDIAASALVLRGFEVFGFSGLVLSWTLLSAVVILPPAIVSGYQFPLLVALLGSGGKGVGRQLGVTYLSNTTGAILGAIASGFGLMALLSAPGVWIASTLVLVALAIWGMLLSLGSGEARRGLVLPLLACLVTVGLMTLEGPTAGWRHAAIGAGRFAHAAGGPHALERGLRANRAAIVWEADGVESSVGVHGGDSYSFLINGKNDGNALGDAPTTVMLSLIPATLHPEPKQALVVGLGTGMSAGWLAEVPSIERVDVVELEPAIEHVARLCAPVNYDVLDHPKVHFHYGDGRELLITTDRRYDVIVSEPSNPWRAGVASLFSQDFYRHAASRLTEDGIFGQWVQVYEIDAPTLRTLIATLTSVFPHVEVWATTDRDLLLTARLRPVPHDLDRIAARLEEEPQSSALRRIWRLDGIDGFYAGYVASAGLASQILEQGTDRIDTDADPVLEFGFSRGLGGPDPVDVAALRRLAAELDLDRPEVVGAALDFEAIEEARLTRDLSHHADISAHPFSGFPRDADARRAREAARHAYRRGGFRQVRDWWFRQPDAPRHPIDLLMLADALARTGDTRNPEMLSRLDAWSPTEGAVVRARSLAVEGDLAGATESLADAFERARSDPWSHRPLMSEALAFAVQLAERDPELGKTLFAALSEPFVVNHLEAVRQRTRLDIAEHADLAGLCVEAFAAFEPHVPWEVDILRRRKRCYEVTQHELLVKASLDLERMDPAGARLGSGLGDAGRGL